MTNKNFKMAAAISAFCVAVSTGNIATIVAQEQTEVKEANLTQEEAESEVDNENQNSKEMPEENNSEEKKSDDSKQDDKTPNNNSDEKGADVSSDKTDDKNAAVSDNTDKVVIEKDDKPYLALGANLSDDQKKTVLSLMGIDPASLDKYDVMYVSNDEEHKYLGEYIPSSEIGTRSLSSVVITKADKGAGLSISTYNIDYCTVGMYKNALTTAGISDANIIVAGPTSISGTAALVGIFKAYEQMSGDKIDEQIVDAAMDELVTTGELNQSIDADPETIEAMIADLKEQIANGALDNEENIREAIKEAAKKYDINLSEENIEKILALLNKLKDLDLDWEAIADRASELADKLGIDVTSQSFWDSILAFFDKLIDAIASIFG
ncbi:MAG: DUF1002 domain-containing protein [Agathobacter sp.]|nr:DUF1002 domain-containing protein [Agathobacter sp.]